MGVGNSHRVQAGVNGPTKAACPASARYIEQGPSGRSGQGSQQHVTKEGNTGSNSGSRSISQQAIYDSEEGWHKKTSSKSTSAQPVHEQTSLQNGEYSHVERSTQEGRLDGVNRSKGCISVHSCSLGFSQVAQILVEGKAVRVSVPPIRIEQCPKNIHKGHETSYGITQEEISQVSNIHRRSTPTGINQTRTIPHTAGNNDFVESTGFQNQQEKIRLNSNTEDPVFRLYSGLQNNDAEFARGENQEIDSGLQAGSEAVLIVNSDNRKTDREDVSSHTSNPSSPSVLSGPPETQECSLQNLSIIRCNSNIDHRGQRGVEMVDRRHEQLEWQDTHRDSSGYDSGVRCLTSRMGGCIRGFSNRRPLGCTREKTTHQCSRDDGWLICSEGIYERQEGYSCENEDGQHHCSSLRNHMGGTRSMNLSNGVKDLWLDCLNRGIVIAAEHLPGVSNTAADYQSRLLQTSAEWRLNPEIFRAISMQLGPCRVDLFATRLNAQLERYICWKPDPFAMATDALQASWKGLQGYAFPPFCLVGRCLSKIKIEAAAILLIAPLWTVQTWYPSLLEALVDSPILLPQRRDLLKDPFGKDHPMVAAGRLHLAAWKVSGIASEPKEYRKRQHVSSQVHGAEARMQLINQHGLAGSAGVCQGTWIPMRVMSNSLSIS